ncbi:hypothetical protein F4808DRAFT_424252 [Astrocystis sublimbata]|nr:hypothetical protein F4808DRAFT_424252 [Astrocystis sublimbata]
MFSSALHAPGMRIHCAYILLGLCPRTDVLSACVYFLHPSQSRRWEFWKQSPKLAILIAERLPVPALVCTYGD